MPSTAPDPARPAPPTPGAPDWLQISDHEGRLVASAASRAEAMEKIHQLLANGQPWVDVRWGESGTGRRIRLRRRHPPPRPAVRPALPAPGGDHASARARACADGISGALCLMVVLLVGAKIHHILGL